MDTAYEKIATAKDRDLLDVKFLNVPCDIYSFNLSGTGFMPISETVEVTKYSKKLYIDDKEVLTEDEE